MYIFVALLVMLCLHGPWIYSNCTTSFDQRQTGDLNVQIGLKNIQLIALLNGGNEDYVDYDYAYDYSEMTIKPQNGTTPKPLNITNTQTNLISLSTVIASDTTESSLTTNSIVNVTDSYNNTKPHINVTNLISDFKEASNNITTSDTTVNPAVIIDQTANSLATNFVQHSATLRKITADTLTTMSPDTINDAGPTTKPTTHCRRGFVQNNQGKCEFKVHGTSNALRRIIKLAQKIKIGKELKET